MKERLLMTMLALAMAGSPMACAGKGGVAPISEIKTETQAGAKTENAKAGSIKAETEAARGGAASGEKHLTGMIVPTKDPQRWNWDRSNTKAELGVTGYEIGPQYVSNDVQTQVSQVENMISNGCEILVTASIDGSSLSEPLGQAKEAGILVISYDRFLMNSDAVTYYATFDNYIVGQKQGEYLVKTFRLEGSDRPFNIEMLTGDPADSSCNFFFGGVMDVLQPYIDSGELAVESGQTTFEQVAIANWDLKKARNRMNTIIAGNYSDDTILNTVPYSNDSTVLSAENALASFYIGEYPIVIDQDCDIANVRNLTASKQVISVFKDTCTLASRMVKVVDTVMQGGEAEVNDTQSYDNGTGVIPTYLYEPVAVTVDNYKEILIDSGYYTENQLKQSNRLVKQIRKGGNRIGGEKYPSVWSQGG